MIQSRNLLISDTINPANPAGIARYFQAIFNALVNEFGSSIVLCTGRSMDSGPARPVPFPWFRGCERLHVHDAIASVASLAFHPNVFYSPYYGRAHTSAAQAFTIYDMTHELFLGDVWQTASSLQWFIGRKKRCIEQAAALFAISHSTARAIVESYPHVDPSKILVTPLGVDDAFFKRHDDSAGPPFRPYFLYVGNRTPYKNFDRLLDALAQAGLAKDFDLQVNSPTGTGLTAPEVEKIDRLGLTRSVRVSAGVSESELARTYALSTALVYPSLYEGFGLPILEALASGTLVATSNTSSMPEVGGDAALYFDPHDTEDMAERLKEVAALSAQERAERVSQGIARARSFPWTRCQNQTVEAIKALMP